MPKQDFTQLKNALEKNERKALALLTMIDGGFDIELIRLAVEQLCESSENLNLKIGML